MTPSFYRRADDMAGDFAAVGDEEVLDHGATPENPPRACLGEGDHAKHGGGVMAQC